MAKKITVIIVAVITLTAIFCACRGGNPTDGKDSGNSTSGSETESNSTGSDSGNGDGVVRDENGEWWGIDF